jgi:hypothetical protein
MQKIDKDIILQNPQRRLFLTRILGGIAGVRVAGFFVPRLFRRPVENKKNDKNVQVTINPLAVPRTEKEVR